LNATNEVISDMPLVTNETLVPCAWLWRINWEENVLAPDRHTMAGEEVNGLISRLDPPLRSLKGDGWPRGAVEVLSPQNPKPDRGERVADRAGVIHSLLERRQLSIGIVADDQGKSPLLGVRRRGKTERDQENAGTKEHGGTLRVRWVALPA
jgi:hypothetical protein